MSIEDDMASRDHAPTTTGVREPVKPSEVLDAAADLIEPEGAWTQGAFARIDDGTNIEDLDLDEDYIPPTCFCLFGALNVAQGNAPDTEHWPTKPEPADIFIRQALGFEGDAILARVSEWNDAPERTQAEVVAKLREAAELARSEGQ